MKNARFFNYLITALFIYNSNRIIIVSIAESTFSHLPYTDTIALFYLIASFFS